MKIKKEVAKIAKNLIEETPTTYKKTYKIIKRGVDKIVTKAKRRHYFEE